MIKCPKCKKSWTSSGSPYHCRQCHELFKNWSVYSMHTQGGHAKIEDLPEQRRARITQVPPSLIWTYVPVEGPVR
jgi:tRNA(Ile2) C34 agmatinyltransferase TiaS